MDIFYPSRHCFGSAQRLACFLFLARLSQSDSNELTCTLFVACAAAGYAFGNDWKSAIGLGSCFYMCTFMLTGLFSLWECYVDIAFGYISACAGIVSVLSSQAKFLIPFGTYCMVRILFSMYKRKLKPGFAPITIILSYWGASYLLQNAFPGITPFRMKLYTLLLTACGFYIVGLFVVIVYRAFHFRK